MINLIVVFSLFFIKICDPKDQSYFNKPHLPSKETLRDVHQAAHDNLLNMNTYDRVSDDDVSEECSSALSLIRSEAASQQSWALKIIDSDGKLGAGILQGNTMWLGRHDYLS